MAQVKLKLKHCYEIEGANGEILTMQQVEGVWNGLVCLEDKQGRKLIVSNQPRLSESMALLLGESQSVNVVSASPDLAIDLGLVESAPL